MPKHDHDRIDPRETDADLANTAPILTGQDIHGPAAHRQQAAQTRHRRASGSQQACENRTCGEQQARQGGTLIASSAHADHDAAGTPRVELVDAADLPGGGQLRLMRRGGDFSIQFGHDELMGSQLSGSEEALATVACRRLGNRADRVLIGGLGMGFTLGAALSVLPASTEIVVAELVPKVVEWARGPLAHLFGDHLADPRVSLRIGDVHDMIVGAPGGFDGILLDVDNGPDGLIHLANDRLYCNWGLRSAYAALRPGGVLAVWSAYTDDAFVDRLQNAGFTVEEMRVRATGGRTGARHTIWLASKRR